MELKELWDGKWLRQRGSHNPVIYAPYNEEHNTIILGIVVLFKAPGKIIGEYWLNRKARPWLGESYVNVEL